MKSTQENRRISAEIIALERAALDRWGKGDITAFTDISAEEVTYFDTDTKRRVDGLEALRQLYLPRADKIKIERYDMLNPSVQVHDNTAVLTFNLIDHIPTAEGLIEEEHWNATEVYCRINGQWKIIHTHWSHIRPTS